MPALPSHILPELPHTELIYVQGGSFLLGDRHKPITVPDFAIGKYPVTQEFWQTIMHNNPSRFKDSHRPAESVSWYDAQEFLTQLNLRCSSKLPAGCAYCLPSESQWEYAARGDIQTQNDEYAGGNDLDKVGWYNDNSHRETKAVGLKLPNELGLYEMSGNVFEWCEDHGHESYEGAPEDGSPWLDESQQYTSRVIRGGSWGLIAQRCRSAYRHDYHPADRLIDVGFRVVLFFPPGSWSVHSK
jgi:formylglycine-generating enzyme required for sulfatase activity